LCFHQKRERDYCFFSKFVDSIVQSLQLSSLQTYAPFQKLRRITKRRRGRDKTEARVRGTTGQGERKEKTQKEKNKFADCFKIFSFLSHLHSFFQDLFRVHALSDQQIFNRELLYDITSL